MDQGDYVLFEDTHSATADECGMNADKPEEYTCDHFAIGKQNELKTAMLERADDYKIDTDIQDSSNIPATYTLPEKLLAT